MILALLCVAAVAELVERSDFGDMGKSTWLVLAVQGGGGTLKEEFTRAAIDLKTNQVNYTIVDCAHTPSACLQLNVTSPPQVILFHDGVVKDYQWEWNFDGFFELGRKLSAPAVYNLQRPAVFEHFKNYELSFLLWLYPQSMDPVHLQKAKLLETVAKEYHHTPIYFGQAADPVLREREGISFSDLPILKRYGSDEVFDFNLTNFDLESLREFVERYKWGLQPRVNATLWSSLLSDARAKKQIIIAAFVNGSNYTHYTNYEHSMKIVAWERRKAQDYRYQMALIDVEKYPQIAAEYEIESGPAIVSIDQRNGTKVGYGYFAPEKNTEAKQFLHEVWEGKTLSKRLKTSQDRQDRPILPVGSPKMTKWEMLAVAAVVGVAAAWWMTKTGKKTKKR